LRYMYVDAQVDLVIVQLDLAMLNKNFFTW
jgi:hypothetical protein